VAVVEDSVEAGVIVVVELAVVEVRGEARLVMRQLMMTRR
jgi:hypothetical protein